MISKEKIMEEIDKMKNWPMTPDNISTLAAMLYVKENLDDEDDDDDYPKHGKKQAYGGRGGNREGMSVDPYAAQRGGVRGKGGGDQDMEKMFRKFMEQYYSER